jgi:hypothetical protein
VALPALIVLVLVAVVAVAASGSVPRGSSASRPPSTTLLDTLFTLWMVAVVAGGVLLVYGLLQRQAVAKQLATLGHPRVSAVAWIVFFGLLAVLVSAFWRWHPRGFDVIDEERPFGGPGKLATTTDTPLKPYEPSVSWLPIAAVVVLVVAAAIAYVVSARRSRPARDPRTVLAEDLASALDDALDDLRAETDPRRAIIAAYARLERVLSANGIARHASETSDEYLARVLHDLELRPEAIGRLTELYTQAKFSHHDVDSTMKDSAIEALEQVRNELRALNEQPHAPESQAPRAATT